MKRIRYWLQPRATSWTLVHSVLQQPGQTYWLKSKANGRYTLRVDNQTKDALKISGLLKIAETEKLSPLELFFIFFDAGDLQGIAALLGRVIPKATFNDPWLTTKAGKIFKSFHSYVKRPKESLIHAKARAAVFRRQHHFKFITNPLPFENPWDGLPDGLFIRMKGIVKRSDYFEKQRKLKRLVRLVLSDRLEDKVKKQILSNRKRLKFPLPSEYANESEEHKKLILKLMTIFDATVRPKYRRKNLN